MALHKHDMMLLALEQQGKAGDIMADCELLKTIKELLKIQN